MTKANAVVTHFDRLTVAVTCGDILAVRAAAAAIKRDFVAVHDGFTQATAATLSHLVDLTSAERGEAIGRAAMQRHMQGPWFKQYIGPHDPTPEVLRARIREIVTTWHWHPSTFTLTEDDERVTLHSHPCGSGMRLELSGRYDGEAGWHRSAQPSESTFMEVGFPMYCNHCPEMNRAGLLQGSTTWLVEGWRPSRAPERQACRQHSYKRLADVPDEFFLRVGLEPPTRTQGAKERRAERLFSEEELAELATHPCDRVAQLAEDGKREAALDAADACRAGWRGMHDAYPIWLASLWGEVASALSEDALLGTLERSAPELVAAVVGASAADWTAFWSMHLGLRTIESGRGTTFTVDGRVFVGDGCPVSLETFCVALVRGLRSRGWADDVGTFAVAGDTLIHRTPST